MNVKDVERCFEEKSEAFRLDTTVARLKSK